LLAVLLVIGGAGVAWGGNGDPLILGHHNRAVRITWLTGGLDVEGEIDVQGHVRATHLQGTLDPYCSGTVTIPAGRAKASSRFTSGDCDGLQLVAMINGTPPPGVWATGVRNASPRDQPRTVVYLNTRTPAEVTVGFVGFTATYP
jgi:hypothetical protein